MRRLDNLRDVGSLKLKSISIDVINQIDSDRACKRQYDATRSENYVATKIYYDLNQYFDVKVFKELFGYELVNAVFADGDKYNWSLNNIKPKKI